MRARIFERKPFPGGVDLALRGLNVGPHRKRSVEEALQSGTKQRKVQFDGDIPLGDRIVLQILRETNHCLPEMKVGLTQGRIEFDSFEADLDDVGFRNGTLLKTGEIQLHELLKRLLVLFGDLNTATCQNGFKVEAAHLGHPAPHRISEAGFRR